ncbi:MAG: T9SS type A sorting domain-containing protein [Ignavibacteria bacterium]|nr:T9SS type A sorting domain-containing protein [Ignavibacteria bacterium]
MKILATLFSCLLLCSTGWAQLSFTTSSESQLFTGEKLPSDAVVVVPPKDFAATIRSTQFDSQKIAVSVPTRMGTWVLDCERFEVMMPTAVVVKRTAQNEEYHQAPHHALIRGVVRGIPNSYVYMAVFENFASAIIEVDEAGGKRRWIIAPDKVVSGKMATHVFYEERADGTAPWRCHAEELPNYQSSADEVMRKAFGEYAVEKKMDSVQSSTQHSLGLALECSYSYYQKHDTSFAYAAQYAITLAGACSSVFQRDANVKVVVPYLRVWTVDDPYPGEIGDKLGLIRTVWENSMQHVQRSTTCLLSGSGGGGLAWVGVLCGGYAYNVSGVNGKVNFPSAGYVWDIDVVSHELGHNIGSSHTHNCAWNPPLDSCWNSEGGCYKFTLPQRGTIMSYCHLQWQGTALTFHPRVASLFNAVMEQAACVWPSTPKHDTDVAVVAIAIPRNGAVVKSGELFTPSVMFKNVGTTAMMQVSAGYRITTRDNVTLLTNTLNLGTLFPDVTVTKSFPPIKLDTTGDFLFEAFIVMKGDDYLPNNKLVRPIQVANATARTVKVLVPNGGETLATGSKFTVKFQQQNTKKLTVQYSTDDGEQWLNVRSVVVAGVDSVDWIVPATPTTKGRIRVSDLDNGAWCDISDGPFTIQTQIDVQPIDITRPLIRGTVQSPVTPEVVVRNTGSQTANNVSVRLTMRWVRRSTNSYDTTIVVSAIAPTSSVKVAFPESAYLADGVHVIVATVSAVGDADTTNNTFGRDFTSIGLSPPRSIRVEPGAKRVQFRWELPSPLPLSRVELWGGISVATMKLIRSFNPSVMAYIVNDLDDDVSYTCALRTVLNNQSSVFTDLFTVTPHTYPGGLAIPKLSLISPLPNALNVSVPLTLRWESAANYDRYEVQIASDSTFQNLRGVYITTTDGALLPDVGYTTTLWWRVRALNQTVNGEWSDLSKFTSTKNCAGNALSFDGSAQNASSMAGTWSGGPVTVEYWTRVAKNSVKNSTSFMLGETDNSRNRFQAHSPWSDENLYWDYGDISNNGRLATSFSNYLDKWTHVALVSDAVGYMAIYLNGELVEFKDVASSPSNLNGVTLGSMRNGNFFNGQLDEFRIWNVVRTPDQIRLNMNVRTQDLANRSSLIHAWSFNEVKGLDVADDGIANTTLTIPSLSMRVASLAAVGCDVIKDLPLPGQFSGASTNHWESWLSWASVADADCYELELFVPDGPNLKKVATIPNQRGLYTPAITGLPASTLITAKIRGISTSERSEWATAVFKTADPCNSAVSVFDGKGSFFNNSSFTFDGRAGTVEFWTYVVDTALVNGSTFRIGTSPDQNYRMQAHVPWSDKMVQWDAGNYRAGGRLGTSFANKFNKWTHVALTTNGIDEMHIFFDGVEVLNSDFASALQKSIGIAIGGHPEFGVFFKGQLSDVRVWNIMRSEEQIRESMYERMVGQRSGLVGSWLFDDARDSIAQDVTMYANDVLSNKPGQWAISTQPLAQAKPWLRGPAISRKADSATYTLHGSMAGGTQWVVTGGTIMGAADARTVRVAWSADATIGTICVTRSFPGGCSDKACFTIELQNPVGVQESIATEFSLTPNPATETITVRIPEFFNATRIEVFSVNGLYVGELNVGGNSIAQLPSGTYIVRVYSNEKVLSKLFSIVR